MLVRPFIQPISAFDVANGNGTATVGVLGGDVVETVNYEIYKDTVLVYSSSISVTDNVNPNTGLPIDGVRNFAITLASSMGLMNNNSYTIRVYTQNATLSETSGYSSVQYFSCYVAPSVSLKDSNGVAVGNNYEFTSQSGNLYVDFAPNDSSSPVILNSAQISIQGYDGSGYSEIYNSGMVYTPFTIKFDNLTPTENDNSNFTQYKLILTAETVQGMKLSNTYTGLTCAYTITSATDIFVVENNAIEGNIKVSMNLSTINGVAEPTATYTQVSDTKYNLDRTASGSKVTFSNQFNVATPYEIKFWFMPNASGDVIAQFVDNGNTYPLTYTLENGTTPTFTLTGGSIPAVSGTTENKSAYYYVSVVSLLSGFSVTVKNAYLATFDADGGTPETNSVYSNEIVQMPTDPEKEGYSFNGWYWYQYLATEDYLALKNAICQSTVGGTIITETTLAELSSLKGNTKQFNQLVRNGNITDSSYIHNYSSTYGNFTISNNVLTYVYKGGVNYGNALYFDLGTNFKTSHKYLLLIDCDGSFVTSSSNKYRFFARFSNASGNAIGTDNYLLNTQTTHCHIFMNNTLTSGIGNRLYFGYYSDNVPEGETFTISKVQLFDITAMGLDSITTVDEFTSLYPKAYYDYNAGTLYNSVISGLTLTGRNLFDKSTAINGKALGSNGALYDSVTRSVSGYIEVKQSMSYYIISPAGTDQYTIWFYDINKIAISGIASSSASVTSPSNAYYARICAYTTRIDEAILNVSDASFNGQYEPYRLSTINLPSTQTLGGVGTAQDGIQVTKNENDDYYTIKKIKRVESVDLGTKTWQRFNIEGTTTYLFATQINEMDSSRAKILSNSIYTINNTAVITNLSDLEMMSGPSVNYIYIRDDSFSDASTFKTAMSGVMLTYELATPVETTLTETSTLAEVSAIRENGGMIGVVGNTNEDYAQPDVTMDLSTKETVQLPFQMTENTKFFADYTQN